jgi:hypothetical protein
MDNGDRQMTINIDLDTAFANAQTMANLIQDDPNPYRTAYVRLIGELEAVLIGAYRVGNDETRREIESHLGSVIRRQRAEIARRHEDAEVARRIENFSE